MAVGDGKLEVAAAGPDPGETWQAAFSRLIGIGAWALGTWMFRVGVGGRARQCRVCGFALGFCTRERVGVGVLHRGGFLCVPGAFACGVCPAFAYPCGENE